MLSIQHQAKKFFTKICVPNSVKENRTLLITETRDDRVRRRLSERSRLVVRKNLYRQRVSFSRSIEITYFNEPKLGSVGFGRKSGTFKHAHLPKRAGLGAEPGAIGDVIG